MPFLKKQGQEGNFSGDSWILTPVFPSIRHMGPDSCLGVIRGNCGRRDAVRFCLRAQMARADQHILYEAKMFNSQ